LNSSKLIGIHEEEKLTFFEDQSKVREDWIDVELRRAGRSKGGKREESGLNECAADSINGRGRKKGKNQLCLGGRKGLPEKGTD